MADKASAVPARPAPQELNHKARLLSSPARARLASTVLLIRDGHQGLEVWVQERVRSMSHYAGMTVFPGGGVDSRDFPTDLAADSSSGTLWAGRSLIATARTMRTSREKAHALVFAAVRELFEETGTLLAVDHDGNCVADAAPYHSQRLALESHRLSLTEVFRAGNLQVHSELLCPWARWVGRSEAGVWFDTFSFLAIRPKGQDPDIMTTEADSAGWFPPQLLLDGWRAGLVNLVIPTWAQLARLARCRTVAEAMAEARNSDMRPVIGEPADEPMYREFYSRPWVNRI